MSTEVRQAVLQYIEEHGAKNTPWVVPAGTAAQLDSVAALLESEMFGDEQKLVKTMRVCRDALLSIYNDVQHRELACMMQCRCVKGGPCYRWPDFSAGCATGQGNAYRLGGRLWDVVEFLRQHHGYESPTSREGRGWRIEGVEPRVP